YHPQVNNLDQWKRLYALKACEAATAAREAVQAHFGETAISLHGELTFRAVNPHDVPLEEMFVCDLEHFYGHEHFEVLEEETGRVVPHQISRYSRGPELCLPLTLAPKEVKTFMLRELPAPALPSAGLCARTGIEGVDDLAWRVREKCEKGGCATIQGMENGFFCLRFEKDRGVVSIFDKRAGRELIAPGRPYAAFTPVYERTPRDLGEDHLFVRRNMGRNRKAFRTCRSAGVLYDVKVLENGPVFSRAELRYKMEGVQECAVILTLHHHMPRLDADLRLHKDSVWEPENLYLSLPFAAQETWLDKAGAVLRPRVDQLPGSCVDFYAVQNGVLFAGEAGDTLIACRDTPLIAMGPLEAHPIALMGEDVPNCDETYAWVMNNFWETNFKASLGGFYQFRYTLTAAPHAAPQQAFAQAEAVNEGALQFYRFVPKPGEVRS
ncbi:MAG: glycoside hydrolase family 38 C-terminal domain-containing protein, partial [Oscillospiraceae bacterium]|nr:glycoside hydrolase family 38 C-terminal domain-containing protein [Oscillospiraceae bacterium]